MSTPDVTLINEILLEGVSAASIGTYTGSDQVPIWCTVKTEHNRRKEPGFIANRKREDPTIVVKAKVHYKFELRSLTFKLNDCSSIKELQTSYDEIYRVILSPWKSFRRTTPQRFRERWSWILDRKSRLGRKHYRKVKTSNVSRAWAAYKSWTERYKTS